MRFFRSARWFLFALLLPLVPAPPAHAGVFISVGFAPPVLPVYVQPPCPEPNLIWTPGFWAYGPDGYYWVPGAWVPAPYEGALWTPPYWGWETGVYVFHPGYWGPHVGYYGGVNYGFGYMGVGFVGGGWRGHEFAYNTAVVHVNETIIHTTYVDRTIVERNTIVNDRRVAFSGGPNGIRHEPAPEERMAMRENHIAPTSFQQQHIEAARADHQAYARFNGGRPQNVAMARPLAAEHRPAPMTNGPAQRPNTFNGGGARPAPEGRPAFQPRPAPESRPAPQNRPEFQQRPAPESRPAPQNRPEFQQRQAPESRPAPQNRPQFQQRPAPESRPEFQQRPNHEPRPEPQQRPAPQARPAPEPREQSHPRPESHDHGHEHR